MTTDKEDWRHGRSEELVSCYMTWLKVYGRLTTCAELRFSSVLSVWLSCLYDWYMILCLSFGNDYAYVAGDSCRPFSHLFGTTVAPYCWVRSHHRD